MTSALLLGDANCVFDDAEAALKLFTPDLVAACNNIGIRWEGHVDHWMTLHPRQCADWEGIELAVNRRVREGRNKPITWGHKAAPGIDRTTDDWLGSTGLFAVKALIEIGCNKIVLAGVPMTEDGAHYYSKHKWVQAPRYHRGWTKHQKEIAPYVRSMSGWTGHTFGAPDEAWFKQ